MIIKITNVEEKMACGYTHPFRVTCDDGKLYIAKFINGTCNGKSLFNEIVAARFASLMNLPIPNFSLGWASSELVNESVMLSDFDVKPGVCFLSEYLRGTPGMNPVILKNATNNDDFPGIILFDQIIMNSDRGQNLGNWYLKRDTRKLYILDHTNIFRLAQIWDEHTLREEMTVPPHLIEQLDDPQYKSLVRFFPGGPNPFSPAARILTKISYPQLSSCVADIPDSWGITESEKKAVLDFLQFQVNHVKDTVGELEIKYKTRKGV